MAPTATLQASGEQSPLDDTMGAMLIGVIVSAVLYGVSLVQSLYYFSRYSKDAWYIRTLVWITVWFDTLHLAFISHTVYHYLITDFYHPERLRRLLWSVVLEALFTGVTGVLVQLFYTMRVWRLSKKNVWLTGLLVFLTVCNGLCGTVWVVLAMRMKTYQELLTINPLTITINALSAAADILIALTLCVMLRQLRDVRTGNFQRSDVMVRRLIYFVVNTGLLTSICAVGSLIALLAAPNTLIYATFYFCIGRLYTASFLTSVNARKSIRNGVDDEVNMVSTVPDSSATEGRPKQSTPIKNISIQIDTVRDYKEDFELDHKSPQSSHGQETLAFK